MNRWLEPDGCQQPTIKLFTRQGREIPVISGSVPPHLTRGTGGPTMPAISDIVFDGGFADKAEAESFGIRPGDTIVPDSSANSNC